MIFSTLKKTQPPENKELNSVFLKALLMPPELTAVKVQINFSLIYYYDPYFCNRVQVQTNNTIIPLKIVTLIKPPALVPPPVIILL